MDLPDNVGLPLFHKQGAMAIHMEIHFDNPTFKEGMSVSGGVRFYYMNDQLENKAGILELGDPVLSLIGDEINDGLTKYQFTCGGDCSRTFANGSNNSNGVTVFNEFLHMHKTGVRMTNEVVRGDNVVHSAAVDVYDFPQQGGFHTPQSSYQLLPGKSRLYCFIVCMLVFNIMFRPWTGSFDLSLPLIAHAVVSFTNKWYRLLSFIFQEMPFELLVTIVMVIVSELTVTRRCA